MTPLDITTETFEQEVLEADTPVLIDFWAPWCGPCRRLAPVLDRLASEELKVVKVNVDEHPALASAFGVRGIPNLVLMKDRKALHRIVGLRGEAELRREIDQALAA